MKIRILWITYTPIPEVKVKFPIDQEVEWTEEELVKLFNSNLKRVYDLSPEALDNPHLINLETEYGTVRFKRD